MPAEEAAQLLDPDVKRRWLKSRETSGRSHEDVTSGPSVNTNPNMAPRPRRDPSGGRSPPPPPSVLVDSSGLCLHRCLGNTSGRWTAAASAPKPSPYFIPTPEALPGTDQRVQQLSPVVPHKSYYHRRSKETNGFAQTGSKVWIRTPVQHIWAEGGGGDRCGMRSTSCPDVSQQRRTV